MDAGNGTTDGAGQVRLDPTWHSLTGPHGGYLASLLLAAAASSTPAGHVPRSLSASFLSPPDGDRASVRTRCLHAGRSTSVVAAEIGPADRPAVVATITAGTPCGDGPRFHLEPPDVPAPEDVATEPVPAEMVPFAAHVEFRPVGDGRPFVGGPKPELMCWLRFADGRPVGPGAVAILLDALPPALYATTAVPLVVPTVDLQVVFAQSQRPRGWVLARITTRVADGGWCVDDSDVWSPDGVHLGQARQTRRVLGELR